MNFSLVVIEEIKEWLKTTEFNDFYERIVETVIGQDNLRLILANVYNYLSALSEDIPVNNNTLLAAPSGCGKTETFRALRDYFAIEIPDLPVYMIDTAQLSPSGYKGTEAYTILHPYYKRRINEAMGICFLDEFDKKINPSYTSEGNNFSADVQQSILTIIEGGDIQCDRFGVVNSSKMMFVGLGSFDHFRTKRETPKKSLGFGAELESEEVNHYAPITRDEMIDAGGAHELIGRFPLIVNYDKLSDEAIQAIIDKTIKSISDSFNCEVQLEKDFKDFLNKRSNGKFGCRLIDSDIRTRVLNEYSLALMESQSKKKLVVKLIDENLSEHSFRNYTAEERKEKVKENISESKSKDEALTLDDLIQIAKQKKASNY